MKLLFSLSFSGLHHFDDFVRFYFDGNIVFMDIIIDGLVVLSKEVSLSNINSILESIHPDKILENKDYVNYNFNIFDWHLKKAKVKNYIHFDIDPDHATIIVHISIADELTKRFEAIKSLLYE